MTDREYNLALRDILGNSKESCDLVKTHVNEVWVTKKESLIL